MVMTFDLSCFSEENLKTQRIINPQLRTQLDPDTVLSHFDISFENSVEVITADDFQWVQDRVDRGGHGSRGQNITSSNPIGTPYILILFIFIITSTINVITLGRRNHTFNIFIERIEIIYCQYNFL